MMRTNIDKNYFKMRLERQRHEVVERMGVHQHAGEADPDPEIDQDLADSEENLMEKIDASLLRLEKGTYGQCANCGANIKLERLTAKPSVSLCIDCQSKKEQSAS
jgi:DnaK suppressor protein